MKKIYILLFAAVIALACASCGNSAITAVSGERGVSAVEEAPEDEADAEPTAEDFDGHVTGTVVYYDGATLAICSIDNTNLNFLVADDDIDKSETRGLAVGSEVDVYYIGEVNGSNTSAAQVIKLAQSLEQSEVRADLGVTGGIIADSDTSVLSIISFDGEELTFSIADEKIDMEHTSGLTTGDYVTVFYEGETGGNGSPAKAVKLVQ